MLKVARILSLGPLEVRDGKGNAVHGIQTQPKRAALLVYLAAARPRGYHRRDHLLALFWPELDEARARPALNQALTYLRRELGQQAIVSRGPEEVGLDPQMIECDVPAFEAALQRHDWAAALELYRGDFLTGFHISEAAGFADWVDRERDRLRREAARAAGAQAERAASEGNPTVAIEAARRALDLEPYDEPSLRRLMQLLDESGDRAAATLAFGSFRTRLRDELGVGPSPESEALFQFIRSRAAPKQDSQPQRPSVNPPPEHQFEQPPSERNRGLRAGPVEESIPAWKRDWVGVAGRAALLVVIIAAVSFVVSRSAYGPAGLGAAGEARFISALDGYETQPALSPNGDMVAFAWAATGVRTRRIMVMPITGGTPRALTDGVHDDSQPAWSPDGREVAFLRREAGDSTFAIMTAPVIGGGVPRKLLSTRSSYGLDWSPTGDFLAYVDRPDARTLDRIFLLSLADGAKRQLTHEIGPGLNYHFHPAFSGDGRTVAFLSILINSGANGAVYTQSVEGGASLRRSAYGWAWDVDWAPGDQHLILATGDFSSRYLVAIPLSGSAPERLSGGQDAAHVATSAGSPVIVYAEVLRDHDIVQIPGPLSSERGSKVLIRSSRDDVAPSYSPDGRKVAYVSAQSGSWELWVANADGSGERRLTNLGHALFPEWSPDSRSIVFSSVRVGLPGSVSDVFIVDADGGIPRNMTLDERRDAIPTWSHDGQWIYYQSRSDSTNWQVWRKPPEGGSGEFVLGTSGAILRPRAAASGDLYYYAAREDRNFAGWVWRRPADGSSAEPLVPVIDFGSWTVWNDKIVHWVERDSLTMIEMFDPLTGTPTLLAAMPSVLQPPTPEYEFFSRPAPMLDVSNDGQWIALVVSGRAGSDLVLWKGPWQD